MRLLDRYLSRELLTPLFFCLAGFFVFWVTADLFREQDELKALTLVEILGYYAVLSPKLIVEILPVTLLLALLYALSNHARHNEITAIRAAGVSLWRLSLPYFGVGLAASITVLALNELLVPDSQLRAEAIKERHGGEVRADRGRGQVIDLGFTNTRERREWMIRVYDVGKAEMTKPEVISTLADGSQRWLRAARATYDGQNWVFYNAEEYRSDPRSNASPVPTLRTTNALVRPEFTETPDEIRSEIKIGRRLVAGSREADLPLTDVLDYLRLHPTLKRSDAWWLYTHLHGRLATPWRCLVVVLIALPFGAASGRRNVFVGVASSIFIAFTFLALTRVSLALGTGGHLPSWLAGWLPNLIFGGTGLWLTARVR